MTLVRLLSVKYFEFDPLANTCIIPPHLDGLKQFIRHLKRSVAQLDDVLLDKNHSDKRLYAQSYLVHCAIVLS